MTKIIPRGVNSNGWFEAVRSCDAPKIKALIGQAKLGDTLAHALSLVDEDGNTLLHSAAIAGYGHGGGVILDGEEFTNVAVARELLEAGASVNAINQDGDTPLHIAAANGDSRMLTLLLERGAKPQEINRKSETPMNIAAGKGYDGVVELLHEACAKLDQKEESSELRDTPLHSAAAGNHLKVINFFGESNVNLDVKNLDGDSALHIAVRNGFEEMATALLRGYSKNGAKNKADVNLQNKYGDTPLHIAAKNGFTGIVGLLLQYNADLTIKNNDASIPLIAAATYYNGAWLNRLKPDCYDEADSWIKELSDDMYSNIEKGGHYDLGLAKSYVPLHIVAKNGNVKLTEKLLENGANIEVQDLHGNTPLFLAAAYGHKEVVKTLFGRGANKEAVNKKALTPMHIAASNGHVDVVKILLSARANKEAIDEEGDTPLHAAAASGEVKALEILLNRGANKEVKNEKGDTPLHVAAMSGQVKAVETLLNNRVNKEAVNKEGNTALHVAAMNGYADVAKVLIEGGANIYASNNDGNTVLDVACNINQEWLMQIPCIIKEVQEKNSQLHAAAMNGEVETIVRLLQEGADIEAVNEVGETPLHIAAAFGRCETIKTLLDRGANINAQNNWGETPMVVAADTDEVEAVGLLFEENALFDQEDGLDNGENTALHAAVERCHTEVVKYFVDQNVSLNLLNKDGYTPLHIAAKCSFTEIVSILLYRSENRPIEDLDDGAMIGWPHVNKANVNKKDKGGNTPLHIAAKYGNVEVAQVLIDGGANIYAKNKGGNTPQDLASIRGDAQILKIFTEALKIIEALSIELQAAVKNGDVGTTKILLDRGANINAKDEEGNTPLILAAANGKTDIVKLLLESGANCKVQNNVGDTIIHVAARNLHSDVIKLFVQYEIPLDQRNNDQKTALHIAVYKHDVETVKALLDGDAFIQKELLNSYASHSMTLKLVQEANTSRKGLHDKRKREEERFNKSSSDYEESDDDSNTIEVDIMGGSKQGEGFDDDMMMDIS